MNYIRFAEKVAEAIYNDEYAVFQAVYVDISSVISGFQKSKIPQNAGVWLKTSEFGGFSGRWQLKSE